MPLTRIKLTAFADGGITTAKLSNTLDLSTKTVTLPDNSVTTSKISNDAVTVDKLNNNLALGGNDGGGAPFTITLPQGVGGTNWNNAIITPSNVGSATIAANNGYYIDTTSGSVTINLPASPSRGDYVCFVDYAGTLSDTVSSGVHSNRIRLNPGTNKLKGEVAIKDIASPRGAVSVVYTDSTLGASGTQGWVVMESANETTTKSLVTSAPTITSILNSLNLSYFEAATDVLTITGTNFVSGSTVTLIDQVGSTETTATITNAAGNSTPTFGDSDFNSTTIKIKVHADAVTAGQSAGEDPFSVKVTGANSSYATLSNVLNYSVAPTFNASPAADANLATVTTSTQAGTTGSNAISSFANISTTITAGTLSPKDPDDTITYAITTLPSQLTGLTIDSSTGALGGTAPSNGYGAADASVDYTFTVTSTATPTESGFESQTRTNTRDFAIKLEGDVTAPTITNVTQTGQTGKNFFGDSGVGMTVTGTGFKTSGTTTVKLIDPTDNSENSATASVASATSLTFTVSAAMISDIQGRVGVTADDRFTLKVINPQGNGSYAKEATLLNSASGALQYFETPTMTAAGDISGTSSLTPATGQSYTGLTAITITKKDPQDTIALSIGDNGGLTGLGISATDNGSTVTGTFTGTGADLSSVATGTKSVRVDVVATSDYDSQQLTTNQTYSVTVASTSSGPGYTSNIQNSLYFNGSSYLEKTDLGSVTATNKYTLSLWAKIIPHSGGGYLFSISNNHGLAHQPDASNAGLIQYWNGSTQFDTPNKLRDFSSWYHIVFRAINASQAQLYINGESIVTANSISVGDFGGSSITNRIGAWYNNATSYSFTGYMANIHFIDGHALSPDYFAQTDTETGSWIPKEYDGTSSAGGTAVTGTTDNKYGTNGFHLDFRPSSLVYSGSTLTTVNDVSGITNPNNWTAN